MSEEISERTSFHLHDHFLYKIIFWETPGKERAIKYLSNYCLGSHLLIILFDVNKKSTFEKAERILKATEITGITHRILIGNKIDLINTKKTHTDPVLQQDAEKLAKIYKCEYFPCNSNLAESVNNVYNSLMTNITALNEYPLDIGKLSEKGIVAGKRVFSHPDFIKSMKEASLFSN